MTLDGRRTDNLPALMTDVVASLLNKQVTIYTLGHTPLGGILTDFNGYVLELGYSYNDQKAYVPLDKVTAIFDQGNIAI
jgi:hypothetical protein